METSFRQGAEFFYSCGGFNTRTLASGLLIRAEALIHRCFAAVYVDFIAVRRIIDYERIAAQIRM